MRFASLPPEVLKELVPQIDDGWFASPDDEIARLKCENRKLGREAVAPTRNPADPRFDGEAR